ncbi:MULTISPECIES: SDR family oxidoreductase [unclassified Micromonospora]|uniref:SDR family NAD(P)-dependent oxidoreductase n=1 Tax=unclassified Micromonospora TaxID=2617518 RepID=UPI00332DB664
MAGLTYDFAGARVLVTGAAGLLGGACARAFRDAKADVVATDRRPAEIPGATVVLGDLTHESFLDRLHAEAGPLDILVNCAAITHRLMDFCDTTGAMLDEQYAANLRPVHGLSARAARDWRQLGRGGVIVNFSSPGATRAHPDQSLYDATKGAIEALSRAMAVELGPYGIRVNCVAPASIGSAGDIRQDAPLRDAVTPTDVSDAVLFLASPAARRITGTVLVVDSGLSAQLRTPSCA